MHVVIGFEVNIVALDGVPSALHKDIVTPSVFAIHGDAYAMAFKQSCEGVAAKLAILASVEDDRDVPVGDSLQHIIYTKIHIYGAG